MSPLIPSIVYSEDLVSLKADHMFYNETTRQVVASSNVSVFFQDLSIQTPSLYLDIDQQQIWGTGNILIKRNQDTIKSASFFFDLDKNKVKVKEVNVAIKPKEVVTGNLYLKVKELEDTSVVKQGASGFATTCDLDHPHYAIYADHFDYYPDQGVYGYNVWIDCPIYFIPFGMWFPVYHYALGKRNPILLVPMIGQNNVEGWFVRSTWDYFIAKGQTGLAYLDWTEKKGVGIGAKHSYKIDKLMDGAVYYYQLKEKDTGIQDFNQKIMHTSHLSDVLNLNVRYENVKGYTIAGARKEYNSNGIGLIYNDLGDVYSFDYSLYNNPNQFYKSEEMHAERSFNKYKELDIKLSKSTNDSSSDSSQSIREAWIISQGYRLPYMMEFTDTLQFTSDKSFSTSILTPDKRFNGDFILTKTFDKDDLISSIKTEVNIFTFENTEAKNRQYIQKVPEITAQLQSQKLFSDIPSINSYIENKMIWGEYQEAHYSSDTNKMRYLTADRIRLEENWNTKFQKMLYGTDFDVGLQYKQNFYQIGDLDSNTKAYSYTPPSFLDGDKLYTFIQTYTHNLDWFGFMTNTLQYIKQDSYGYTPFFFDDDSTKQELFNETLTFYYQSPSKYAWRHTTGWNRIVDRPLNYGTKLTIQPTSGTQISFETSYIFNDENWRPWMKAGYWNDLVAIIDLQPSSNNSTFSLKRFWVQATYDLRKGQLTKLAKTLNFGLFEESWENKWNVESYWEYDLAIQAYKLKTLSLVKDLHCREMKIGYSEDIREWRFTYTIKAFPSDSIGFKTNKNEPFQMQGILDDKGTDRFE